MRPFFVGGRKCFLNPEIGLHVSQNLSQKCPILSQKIVNFSLFQVVHYQVVVEYLQLNLLTYK